MYPCVNALPHARFALEWWLFVNGVALVGAGSQSIWQRRAYPDTLSSLADLAAHNSGLL